MEDRPVNLNQMARILGVRARWLRVEAEAGRVPCVRAEDRFLFNVEAVKRVMLERGKVVEPANV